MTMPVLASVVISSARPCVLMPKGTRHKCSGGGKYIVAAAIVQHINAETTENTSLDSRHGLRR